MKKVMGCYIRLSHADEANRDDQHESNSIRNQRELIHRYLADHPEFSDWMILEFVDDGYSGTTENRPEFQRLLTLVHLGEIHGVIVKDLSRFARNYITMGNYLEQVFPLLCVRFISINDGYDSISANTSFDSMSVTLKAILHSYYSRDLSAKIFSCNTQRMKNGQFAGTPCFGYIMNEDRTHFIIDPEAAKIVRLIFDMALSGVTRPEIVKHLNDHAIPTPADYRQKQGRGKGNMITPHPLWDHVKVSKILRQEAYTGKLIMRKHIQPVPCVKKYRKATPEEQFVRENAHEPIVSREEFDKVQALMPRRKGWDRKNQREYPLKGLVRCGTCGKLMCVADAPVRGGFICKESRIEHSICSPKVHPMADVEQAVYQKIVHQQQLLLRQKNARISQDHKLQTTAIQTPLQIFYRQQSQLQQEKARNYETYISGDLTPEEYAILKKENAQQMLELQNNISILESQLASQPIPPLVSDYVQATRIVNQYSKSTELSRDMAGSFVDQILLFEDHIDIQWKYVWLATEGDQNGQKKSE